MAEDKIGTLVVGGGWVSQISYLDYFYNNESAPLVAIAEPNPDTQEHLKKTYPDTLVTDDYEGLLDRDDVQLVIICTPHNLHHPMVTRALKAGKHVICEKPIAVSVAESDEMIECARECGKKLFVGLNMRYDPRNQAIAQLMQDGQLGKVFLARVNYMGYEVKRFEDPNNWKGDLKRAGGGVLLDGGYHIVDLLNMYFGRAKSVQASGGRLVIGTEGKGEDNALLQIEFESGIVASLFASFTIRNVGCDDEPTLILGFDFFGTEASLFGSYDSPTRESKLDLISHDGRRAIDIANVTVPEIKADFLASIRTDSTPLVTAMDARNAVAVVEAAYASMSDGGRVNVDWKD